MTATARPPSYHYVVDESLLRSIAAEIQAAIPGAEVRLFGSRARGTARPDSDLDLLVTEPDALSKKGQVPANASVFLTITHAGQLLPVESAVHQPQGS